MGNGCCLQDLTGKQLFCVTAFPKVASGKYPWIRQKEQKNYPCQFPRNVLCNLRSGSIFVSLCNNIPAGKAKRKAVAVRENVWEPLKLGLMSGYVLWVENPKRLSQSRQSEMYKTVEIRCWLRAVFVFGAKSHATLGWTQRALSIQPKHWKIRKQGQIVEKFPGNVSRNSGSCWIFEMRIIYHTKILEIVGANKKLNGKKTSGKKFPNIWVHPARLSYFKDFGKCCAINSLVLEVAENSNRTFWLKWKRPKFLETLVPMWIVDRARQTCRARWWVHV